MWYDYFDNIFLINLPGRTDRYKTSVAELSRYGVPYELVRAIGCTDGRDGLYQTMITVFKTALARGYRRILVFEDDLKVIANLEGVLTRCIAQLPGDWDLFYLGCNLVYRPARFFSENLLPLTRALSTHAVAYSQACMKRILSLPKCLPIDLMLANQIQPAGKSYCACPLTVTQFPGYSNIENRPTDYAPFLEDRFSAHIFPLMEKCRQENLSCCRA